MTSLNASGLVRQHFVTTAMPRLNNPLGYGILFLFSAVSVWYQPCHSMVATACSIRGWRNVLFWLNYPVGQRMLSKKTESVVSRHSSRKGNCKGGELVEVLSYGGQQLSVWCSGWSTAMFHVLLVTRSVGLYINLGKQYLFRLGSKPQKLAFVQIHPLWILWCYYGGL